LYPLALGFWASTNCAITASLYSQYLKICKQNNEDVREFNDRFNTLIGQLEPNFHQEGAILQHYLNSLEGELQFTLKNRSLMSLEEAQDASCQIEENLKFDDSIHQINLLNNDDILGLNKEVMGEREHDFPEILEVENNTFLENGARVSQTWKMLPYFHNKMSPLRI
jgi:hypothetical protein